MYSSILLAEFLLIADKSLPPIDISLLEQFSALLYKGEPPVINFKNFM